MNVRSGFYGDKELASTFFDVQRAVFPGLDLQWANEQGLLRSKITPFAIVDENGKAVSILNASEMKIHVRGRDFRAVQIGTVATLPEYRGKGLAGMLQKHVQEKYAPLVDFPFLFANNSVLNFYPKFEFKPIQQTSFKYLPKCDGETSFTSLELNEDGTRLLKRLLAEREGVSNLIDARDADWLAEFYCRRYYADSLWVDEKRETILVASIDGSHMELNDIISKRVPENFFLNFSWNGVSEVRLGFTPSTRTR